MFGMTYDIKSETIYLEYLKIDLKKLLEMIQSDVQIGGNYGRHRYFKYFWFYKIM